MTFELFCHFILLINEEFLNYFHFALLYFVNILKSDSLAH